MKLTIPCHDMVITQKYHKDHKAWDIITTAKQSMRYGVPLCAPEMVKIVRIFGDTYTPGSNRNLKLGYGVIMQGLESGNFHLFWHTLPIKPVSVGDIVGRGKIVAFMGNAGLVRVGGKYVEIERRLDEEKPGTHLHWEIMMSYEPATHKKGDLIDPASLVDLKKLPTYTSVDLLRATAIVVAKMARLIK